MSTPTPDEQGATATAGTGTGTGSGTDTGAMGFESLSGDEAEQAITSGLESGDQEAVLRALAVSVALLPQAPPEDGELPDGAFALPVVQQDGTQFVPVFTSLVALEAAGADPITALQIPLALLAANWPSDDLWLAVNPASEQGLTLPPDVVRALPVFAGPSGDGEGERAAGSGESTTTPSEASEQSRTS